jgi:hypothetical protein
VSAVLATFAPTWVTLAAYCAATGETPGAVRKRRERGEWLDGRHTQVRNRRLWINVEAAQQWVEKGS